MMSIGLMVGAVPEVDPKNKKRAEDYWMYGKPASELAKAWDKPVAMAELKTCANCEYFDNSAKTLKALNGKPGTGACKKFNFMCDQSAACQAWDCPDWETDHGDED